MLPSIDNATLAKSVLANLPTGDAWSKDSYTNLAATVSALTLNLDRVAQRGLNLVADAFPPTTSELLPDWEQSLGLPDPCQGIGPTIIARREQVVARFSSQGNLSIPYIVQFAAHLGYAITITEFQPFYMGLATMGVAALADEQNAYVWQVNAALYNFNLFLMGASAMGEPLGTYGNTVLECEIRRLAPAHTYVRFSYS